MRLKDKIYNSVVRKNPNIRDEYERYVMENINEHYDNRAKHWLLLWRLNWHYRVCKNTTPLILWENPKNSTNKKKENVVSKEQVDQKKSVLPKPQTNTKSGRKFPYLDGAESEISNRLSEVHFAKGLLKYDVISFDIFDTLILRPFSSPADLFMVVGNKLHMMNFMRIRQDAEREARAEAQAKYGNAEITIFDIYRKISQRTGLDVNEGVRVEFETELEFCFANPYMNKIFNILLEQEKEIIIVSDMYLPDKMMKKLLENCGYYGYSNLYVSCDYFCNKRIGGLYKQVLNDYKEKNIIHIGDNYATDIESAKTHGLDTRYYKNCHEIGKIYRAEGMSELIGSYYAGIINTHLHNGVQKYPSAYEYGFIYGGLYVVGFCNWIYRKAKKEGINKILFLSRDGAIYQKVFNHMFLDMENEYVYWSRIANTKYAAENCKADFLTRMIDHKAVSVIPTTIGEMLEAISLGEIKKFLPDYGLKENMVMTRENKKHIEQFILEMWDTILEIFKKEEVYVKQEIKEKIGESKKVAIVDVGWIGSGPLSLKYLIEEKWKINCKVSCYIAGSTHYVPNSNINELMNEETEVYMFSRFYNRNLYDVHKGTNKGTNNIYFELFTQACHPSFGGYTDKGDYKFDVPEVENYKSVRLIHDGIFEFAKLYVNKAKHNRYLLNISGYDAYLPYRFIIKDIKFLRNTFADFSYSRGVGVGANSARETLTDILKQAEL